MCGRYNFYDNAYTQQLLGALSVNAGHHNIPDFFNIAPTQDIPVISEEFGLRALRPIRWWLTPSWSKEVSTQYSMFNARAETVERSRAFQASFRHHRIIVPMSSFIEWRKESDTRQPYLISYDNDACMAAAGIWSQWTDGEIVLDTCALMTRAAVPDFLTYHNRQPLLLNTEQATAWLNEHTELKTLRQLLNASLPQSVKVQAVESNINNSRIKLKPRLIDDRAVVRISA